MTPGDGVVFPNFLARRHPVDRLFAWLIDWLVSLAWVAIVAAIGVPLFLSGMASRLDVIAVNVIAAATLVVPVTGVLAAMESRSRPATIGKRSRRLHVVNDVTGQPVSFGCALVRNGLKVGIPWSIGHAAVYAIITSAGTTSMPIPVMVLTAIAYALPLLYVVCLFIGAGKTLYDRISGTRVDRVQQD